MESSTPTLSNIQADLHSKKPARIILIAALMVIALIIALSVYVIAVGRDLEGSISFYMDELAETTADKVAVSVEAPFNILTGASAFVVSNNIADRETNLWHFSEMLTSSPFESLSVCMKDGKGYGYNAASGVYEVSLPKNADFLKNTLSGNNSLVGPLESDNGSGKYMLFCVPVYADSFSKDKVIGALMGRVSLNSFANLVQSLPFNGHGYIQLIDSTGSFVVTASQSPFSKIENPNLLAAQYDYVEGLDEVTSNLKNGINGHYEYQISGDERKYASYAQVDSKYNDWFVLVVLPDAYLQNSNQNALTKVVLLVLAVVVTIVLSYVFITRYWIRSERKLLTIATTDRLTGMPNTMGFSDAVLSEPDSFDGRHALVVFDVHDFSFYNDVFGYEEGDILIKKIGKALKENLDDNEIIGRGAGERYLLLLSFSTSGDIDRRLTDLMHTIAEEAIPPEADYKLLLRCSIVPLSKADKDTDFNLLIQEAATQLNYTSSKLDHVVTFRDLSLTNQLHRRHQIENIMESALANNEFYACFQPQFDIQQEPPCLWGAEALARWKSEKLGVVYPSEFVPIFEEDGFIAQLDMKLLEYACAHLAHWIAEGTPVVPISVNFSRANLYRAHFFEEVCELVDSYDLDHGLIKIEITESVAMEDPERLLELCDQMHAAGFKVAMDDFGSGYSSIPLLAKMTVDIVKLDKTFFSSQLTAEKERIIANTMLDLLANMNITSVAEGIETAPEVDALRDFGCDVIQGYYFGKPEVAEDFKSNFLLVHTHK